LALTRADFSGEHRYDVLQVVLNLSAVKMFYKVSEVTREFGVTVRALRFYEERGLLKPVRVGTHRRYTADDKTRIASILKGKALGLTVTEIAEKLTADGQLKLSLKEIDAQLRHYNRQRKEIDATIAELEKERAAHEKRRARDSP
jgi:DNA-binding transcriptional MerR regulator